MSSKFESSVREIPYSQQFVYNMLGDLTNIEKVCDRIPEGKIKGLTSDADPISIHSPIGDIQLNIIERGEPKCIKFEAKRSPAPVNLWIQILPVTDHSSKMKLAMEAEVNSSVKAMVKKPLQEGTEKVVDALQVIQYE